MKIVIALLLTNAANVRELEGLDTGRGSAIAKYITMRAETAPPILIDPKTYWIMNGHHRTKAAILRGETEIKYVIPRVIFANEKDRLYHARKMRGQ